jgi:GNAT superfamily N-acetyltransferase
LGIVIDRPRPDDWPRWRHLYQGYAEHYRVPMDDAIAGRLWAWINDPAHPVEAFVARNEGGTPVGLAHYRAMPRPLGGNEICFLDDLFVDPTFRGGRVGEALLRAVAEEAGRRGWGKVRWITADDNYRGRTLYDRVAGRTMWVTYEMPAAVGPGRG